MADIDKLASNINGTMACFMLGRAVLLKVMAILRPVKVLQQQAVDAYTAFDDKAKVSVSDISASQPAA